MQTNFAFISNEFPEIFAEAIEAEKFVYTQPRFSALQSRISIEKAILWLFEHEQSLDLPYNTSLSALMDNFEFKHLLPYNMLGELHIVRKVGNKGAHGDKVGKYEALNSLRYIFRFLSWISKYYSEHNPDIPAFDEEFIPKGQEDDKTKKELKKLAEENEQTRKEIEKQLKRQLELEAENAELRKEVEEKERKYTERKEKREKQYQNTVVVPPLTSEQETRKQLIELLLFEAGWRNLREGVDLEFEVTGMPVTTNPSGKGYVDYVLWGDNGKPLAIVEAKSTLHDPSKGKHQAFLYAECLEKMTGQRPIIFYSNGYENYIWDDLFYPPRKVSGFYTKEELQTLISRRGKLLDLRSFKVNREIAGRPYQMQAIQAVAEAFIGEYNNKIVGRHRKALLVMATGSGKTRVSAAIVDMLTKNNWAKRVLFLADRNALVSQAKNSFNEHLPHLSAIDLTKTKDDDTARIVFSTYPTMMNLIDDSKVDGEKRFGIGHFDLIIVDEAHRSVYQKYQAIFDYFDSLLLGLTATPISYMDRNTYELFDIEDENPTFAYELEQAVKEGYLVPPIAINVPLKFPREGVKYDELSERDKRKYEEVYGIGGIEEEVSSVLSTPKSDINQFFFNNDTIDKVLNLLFERGLKVESGDKIGKTIIFAKNHRHAVFIAERFYENYPEFGGGFLEVIDNYNDKAEDLLDRFKYDKGDDKNPQIAVSVDMMDTGVDAPRVLNLVFFKEVKSAAKFWQMIGRGTRLCPNIFGLGDNTENDKQNFYIFDICGNFEYFSVNPKGEAAPQQKSLTQKLFEAQLTVAQFIGLDSEASNEDLELAQYYKEDLYNRVKNLDESRFAVRQSWEYVKKYKEKEEWEILTEEKCEEMSTYLGKVVTYPEDTDELAKIFDLLIYRLQLITLNNSTSSKRTKLIDEIHHIGKRLLTRKNVPSVKRMESVLKEIQTSKFWETITLKRMEHLRVELRDLIQFLKQDKRKPIYTNITDILDTSQVQEISIEGMGQSMHNYKMRIEDFIRKNKNHLVIDKIYRNIPITTAELMVLEDFLTHEKFDLHEIQPNYETKSLGVFVRKILGMEMSAAQEHFADFIQEENLTNNQIQFINKIIEYLNHNGIMDKNMLTDAPFTALDDSGVIGIFEDVGMARKVVQLVDKLKENLEGA